MGVVALPLLLLLVLMIIIILFFFIIFLTVLPPIFMPWEFIVLLMTMNPGVDPGVARRCGFAPPDAAEGHSNKGLLLAG